VAAAAVMEAALATVAELATAVVVTVTPVALALSRLGGKHITPRHSHRLGATRC
jgi:hypothetical protein